MNRLICGALLVALFSLHSPSFSQERPSAPRSPEQYGRFVITFSPFARADTFLLDTQTGKVWQLTRFTDIQGDPLVFKNLDRIDSEAQFDVWLRSQRLKEPSATPSRP